MAMLNAPADKPVLFDCRVAALANCFPMIPSGKAHHEMLLGEDVERRGDRQGRQQGRQGAGVAVIPAQAGIHVAVRAILESCVGARLRGHDGS